MNDRPFLAERLRRRIQGFRRAAHRHGLNVGAAADGPVVPLYVEPREACLRLAEALRARGVGAGLMVPPAVPPGTSRLRFFVSVVHTEDEIERAVSVVADEIRRLRGCW